MVGTIAYRPRNRWKAVVTSQGGVITKDYSANSPLARFLGRISLNWEEQALTRLEGLEGVPSFVARPSPYCLKMTMVPGIPISKARPGEVDEQYIRKLKQLFHDIHARGVAHGDAHMRNILVHQGRPYLVDFSTAYVQGRSPVLDNYLFKCFVSLDQERIYKVEKKFLGTGVKPKMFWLYRIVKSRR